MPDPNYDRLYDELKEARALMDEAYTVRARIFHTYIQDGSWTLSRKGNEYKFRREFKEEGAFGVLDLKVDTYYERRYKEGRRGVMRSDGTDYVLNMLKAYGGAWPPLMGSTERVATGKVVIPPPYKLANLSPKERRWHENMPPLKEQLECFVRYDDKSNFLYYIEEATAQYEPILSGPSYFIEIDGSVYGRWRIISQLLLGNPYGIADLEHNKELLDAVVTYNETPFKAIHDLHKKLVEEGDRDAPEFQRKYPTRTAAEDAARVAEIRKEQSTAKNQRETWQIGYELALNAARQKELQRGGFFSERLFKRAYKRGNPIP